MRKFIRLLILAAIVYGLIHYWSDIKGVLSHKTQNQITQVAHTVKSDYHKASAAVSKVTKVLTTKPVTSPSNTADVTLCAEPICGYTQITDAILGAKVVDLTMYELDSRRIEGALVAAHQAGANVRVFLDSAYHGYDVNRTSAAFLTSHGVPVRFGPTSVIVHEKALVLNNSSAWIMSGNLDHNDFATSADWLIHDTNPSDVAYLINAFNGDWNGDLTHQAIDTGLVGNLLFSPGAEQSYISDINEAHTSIDLTSEEMIDPYVTSALVSAAKRGVDVRVLMQSGNISPSVLDQLTSAGVHVGLIHSSTFYLHAKTLIVNGQLAVLGSQNDSISSLVYNREVSLVTTTPTIVAQATATFNGWWAMVS